MAEFYVPPEWDNLPPPKLPEIDPDRIEGLQNGFLAATQDALHSAPDAFFRKTGQAAVEGLPALQERLSQLRDAALDQAKDEGERAALAPRLEANLTYLQDGIDRHVAAQKLVRNRQIISERQALTRRAAELAYNDDKSLFGFAEANANAAQELAHLNGADEAPAMDAARSAIWRTAIGQRLATGQGAQALDLFGKVNDRLTAADQRALEVSVQAARTDVAADQWIEREAGKDGEPLATRAQTDANLSPVEKATVLAKVEAQASAQESARLVAVKGLDDRLDATTRTLATQPAAYRPGTLAAIADGYDSAGEPDKASAARRLALQEGFLLPFARSSAAAQQRLIDSLPEGEDRAAAEAIQRQQAEAFAKDAFTAGTALYPDVGPPAPINDLTDRIAQARTIAAYRGIPVAPFTADEIAVLRRKLANGTSQERDALLTQLNALPNDMKAAIVPVRAMSDAVDEPLRDGDQLAQLDADTPSASEGRRGVFPKTEPTPGAIQNRIATRVLEQMQAAEKGGTTEPPPGTPEHQAAAADERRLALEEMKGTTTEPPPDAQEYRAAEAEASRLQAEEAARSPEGSPYRDLPPNDQDLERAFQREPGVKVTLPDGTHIEDPRSSTGVVMAPFNDLKDVAAAGRREREKIENDPGPPIIGEVEARARDALRANVGHGGTFDYQRRHNKYGKDGFSQLPQFRNISNINVGLFAQQFGLSLRETLIAAGWYALTHSRNSSLSKPYFLDDDTRKYIEIGHRLGESGMFD